MSALLALIPSRVWLVGGAFAALMLVIGWYTLHERHVEHAKDVAAAAVVAKKDNAMVAADDTHAQTTETQNATTYTQAVAAPAVRNLGVVCQRAAARSVPLPAASTVETAGARDAAPVGRSGPSEDISGAILTRAHDADAQISYLQGRVAELEAQMNGAP
jgi:hypothetical protein